MQVYTDDNALILRIGIVDNSNDPIEAIAFDDLLLTVSYLLETGSSFLSPVLVDGTLGTYISNSWKEISGGIYQYCPPNAVVVSGQTTLIKVAYSTNRVQYDTIEAMLIRDSAGTGARIVTLTFVDEDAGPLTGVRVRLTNGSFSFTTTTDIDGIASFNVDDGDWTISATKSGYSFSTTVLVVDDDETETYEMILTVPLAPSLPGLCTVRFQIYASDGITPVEDATVNATLDKNTAIDGILLSNAIHSGTTDSNGVCDLVLVQRDSIIKGKQFYHIVATDGQSVLLDIRARVPNQNYTFAEDLIFEG